MELIQEVFKRIMESNEEEVDVDAGGFNTSTDKVNIANAAKELSDRCCLEVVKAMRDIFVNHKILYAGLAIDVIREHCINNGFTTDQFELAWKTLQKQN